MTPKALFQAGRLDEAIAALGAELRDNPDDAQRRSFLFELLCFAGAYERAEKQLDILGQGGSAAQVGALLYRGVIAAERARQKLFEGGERPAYGDYPAVSGTLNGQPFSSIEDADPRIGPKLELFAAGNYLWIPFAQLAAVRIEPPRRLRDLLWTPARVLPGAAFRAMELGEVLLPVLTPFAFRHSDPSVRLGRLTVWQEDEEAGAIPHGQKMLLVDGEEFPLLEVRILEIGPAAAPEPPAD
jgi:type VI secretion system protein ImpE